MSTADNSLPAFGTTSNNVVFSGYADVALPDTKEYAQFACMALKLLTQRKLSKTELALWPKFENTLRLELGVRAELLCEQLQGGIITEDLCWKDLELLEEFIRHCDEVIETMESVTITYGDSGDGDADEYYEGSDGYYYNITYGPTMTTTDGSEQ